MPQLPLPFGYNPFKPRLPADNRLPVDGALRGLDAIRPLPGTEFSPSEVGDPSGAAQLYNLQGQRRRELVENIGRAQRALPPPGVEAAAMAARQPVSPAYSTPGEVAGLQTFLGGLEGEMAGGTIERERPAIESIEAANRAAVGRGFTGAGSFTPGQQAAQFDIGRERETEQIPIRQAEVTAAGNLAQEQARAAGTERVAEIGAGSTPLAQLLGAGVSPEDVLKGDISSITRTGISTRPEPETPQGLLQDVTRLRRAAENSSRGSFLRPRMPWTPPTPDEVALTQAINNVLLRYPGPPELKEYVRAIMADPDSKSLSLEQILQARGETDITPEEFQFMSTLLNAFRGF